MNNQAWQKEFCVTPWAYQYIILAIIQKFFLQISECKTHFDSHWKWKMYV